MPSILPTTSRVRLGAKSPTLDDLVLEFGQNPPPPLPAGHALIQVRHAAINPSDVKAALGLMPQAVWPRTPGRDYAGLVVDGPPAWVGREVWGSGGDVGVTRDGSHGGWLIVPEAALREKPRSLRFEEAGSVGVPFVTAYEGFRRSGLPRPGQVVAVMGANGKVGQAAVQLAAQAGATVYAVQRSAEPAGFACAPPQVIDARNHDVAEALRDHTGGRGADIVFNTVGSPYFEAANRLMAKGATQILIATLQRPVDFDIFTFYRGMHTYVGIDTLALDCVASNERLAAMAAGFEAGTLQPFTVAPDAVYPLHQALAAYRRVLQGDEQRIVLCPDL
ncbi:MAG: zinc-binding alcohol dehydrogenase family protein [Pigmentiphaga sp.]